MGCCCCCWFDVTGDHKGRITLHTGCVTVNFSSPTPSHGWQDEETEPEAAGTVVIVFVVEYRIHLSAAALKIHKSQLVIAFINQSL